MALTARSFPRTFMTDPAHPAFEGLTDEDLDAWHPGNPWDPETPGLVRRLFHKPSRGNARVLLECGEGDFGWGGLLWSPMIEIQAGRGRVLLSQVEVVHNAERVPAACMLLRNLLAFGCTPHEAEHRSARILASAGSALSLFIDDAEIRVAEPASGSKPELVIADPDALDSTICGSLREKMHDGANVLVIAAEPRHSALLEKLAGTAFRVVEAPAYQVAAQPDPATRGVSQSDLFLIDKVTYSPPTKSNVPVARCAVEAASATPLLSGVTAPWVDFFVRGHDAEYLKTAVATMVLDAPATPACYGVRVRVGKGALLVSQVLPLPGNEKVRRFYTRFFSNLGISVGTQFLDHLPDESDYGLDAVMALARESHHDAGAMKAYFTDPQYALNNLGEGVFGWMKRIDARGGAITIPDSAGKTWFVTVFVDSEINRDPGKRPSHELPDPSIVPDLSVRSSCPIRVFLNGRRLMSISEPTDETVKIEDAVLLKGVNRLALICTGGADDVTISAWFLTKHGEPVPGLRFFLTLD
jgi:hypothetical protein